MIDKIRYEIILNLYGGQRTTLDIASTENTQKWPLPSGKRDLEKNHPNSINIVIVVENKFLDAQKTAWLPLGHGKMSQKGWHLRSVLKDLQDFARQRRMKVMAHSHERVWFSLEPETGISGAGCVEKETSLQGRTRMSHQRPWPFPVGS